jgi:outer membrane protein OmpA-like peptidoglycan-associated protein
VAKKLCVACVVYVLFCVAAGCAGTKRSDAARQEILSQFESVEKLAQELTAVEENEAEMLAPEGYQESSDSLDKAMKYAASGKRDKANAVAEEGLATLVRVRKNVDESREILSEVLATRERAVEAGANSLFDSEYKDAELDLRQASALIEAGRTKNAVKLRSKLIKVYAELELRALKKGSRATAKAAIKKAEENEAGEYAPKTLAKAKEELRRVAMVLEADRTQTDKANVHAAQAVWLAGRAEAVTKLARMYDDRDFSLEDIVLWYQGQLEAVNEPLEGDLPFDKPNQEVVKSLKKTLDSLMNALRDARKMMQENQARIVESERKMGVERASYEKKIQELLGASRKELVGLRKRYASELSDKAKRTAENEREALELKERFEYVQTLFEKGEASVEQKNQDVLIKVHGFRFPPGGFEIKAVNFGLLNKVISAIAQFPKSRVVITGHTDSVGNADKNLALSVNRAANVRKFMAKVGGIPESRTESKGFGEKKPVANNGTRKGRRLNRRIQIRIVND